MADRVIMPRALDANGDPVAGAKAYFYQKGSVTPLVVFTDAKLTVPVTTATADAAGAFSAIYTSAPLKIDIHGADETSLPGFPSDDWYTTNPIGVGAGSISFAPIFGNAATTVQAAIQNLTTLWNAVTDYGRTLIAAATASDARTVLGLGGLATVDLIDEDDMASDSATRPPSQQSVKAYVDTNTVRQCVAHGRLDADAGTLAWAYRNGFSATLTDNGTGDYSLQFETALADAEYSYQVTCGGNGGTGSRFFASVDTVTASGFRLYVTDINGVAHIKATFNNTIITITDTRGNVISWASAGKVGFKGSRKSTPYAAQIAADASAREAVNLGLQKIEVWVKGPGSGREAAIRSLQAAGLDITAIKDVTPIPHNGCRPPKRRRV